VKSHENQGGKLIFKTRGPYQILKTDGRLLTIESDDGIRAINGNHATRAPEPHEGDPVWERALASWQVPAMPSSSTKTMEAVFDQFVGEGYDEKGRLMLRVRWFGYGPREDTGEYIEDLPSENVRRYCSRHNIALRQTPERGVEPRTTRGHHSQGPIPTVECKRALYVSTNENQSELRSPPHQAPGWGPHLRLHATGVALSVPTRRRVPVGPTRSTPSPATESVRRGRHTRDSRPLGLPRLHQLCMRRRGSRYRRTRTVGIPQLGVPRRRRGGVIPALLSGPILGIRRPSPDAPLRRG